MSKKMKRSKKFSYKKIEEDNVDPIVEAFCNEAAEKHHETIREIPDKLIRWAHEREASVKQLLQSYRVSPEIRKLAYRQKGTLEQLISCRNMSDDLIKCVTESDYSFADILRCIDVPNIDDACKLANNTSCTTGVKKLLKCVKMSPEMLAYALKNDFDIPASLIFMETKWKKSKYCTNFRKELVDNKSMDPPCLCPHCIFGIKGRAVFCENLACRMCFQSSFASLRDSWMMIDKDLGLRLRKNNTEKYDFKCIVCKHVYDKSLTAHTNMKSGCPFCSSGNGRLCDDDNCDHCFNRSFASHPDVDMFNTERNEISPREVFLSSGKRKYWFVCQNQHEFHMSLHHFTAGQRCGKCKNKTEALISEALSQLYTVKSE